MDKRDSWMAFQILFWTGMRIGELLALQVKDVNFEDGTIHIFRINSSRVFQKFIIRNITKISHYYAVLVIDIL